MHEELIARIEIQALGLRGTVVESVGSLSSTFLKAMKMCSINSIPHFYDLSTIPQSGGAVHPLAGTISVLTLFYDLLRLRCTVTSSSSLNSKSMGFIFVTMKNMDAAQARPGSLRLL